MHWLWHTFLTLHHKPKKASVKDELLCVSSVPGTVNRTGETIAYNPVEYHPRLQQMHHQTGATHTERGYFNKTQPLLCWGEMRMLWMWSEEWPKKASWRRRCSNQNCMSERGQTNSRGHSTGEINFLYEGSRHFCFQCQVKNDYFLTLKHTHMYIYKPKWGTSKKLKLSCENAISFGVLICKYRTLTFIDGITLGELEENQGCNHWESRL